MQEIGRPNLYTGIANDLDTSLDIEKIVSWRSKDFSAKKMTTLTTTDNGLSPSIKWYGNSNFYLVFRGSCLEQKSPIYTPPNRIHFLSFMS